MNEVRESWEDTIDIISSLAGDNYITRKLYINDYGRGIIKYNNREWTSDNGKIVVLGKEKDISFLPNNEVYEVYKLRHILNILYNKNCPFIIGNNFFYPYGIEFDFDNKICIPTDLNSIIYYGNRKDSLGIISKEIYNYVLINNLEIKQEDIKYIKNKERIKKICR